MSEYIVITPPFDVLEPVTDEGQGPTHQERDVIVIEAPTKREAVRIGVNEMLVNRKYTYCREQRMDGRSPFAGVKAEAL